MLAAAWLLLTWRLGRHAERRGRRLKATGPPAKARAHGVRAGRAGVDHARDPFGGWSAACSLRWLDRAGDTTVALSPPWRCSWFPAAQHDGKRLLDWPTAVKIPWGMLLLFGGGIAIAKAFDSSGLSTTIGGLVSRPPSLADAGGARHALRRRHVLTGVHQQHGHGEHADAGARRASAANRLDPVLLMIPAAFSASLAFMLPVATPPNALVFGSGRVRIADMVRVGFVLNLVGFVIVTLVCWELLPLVFPAGR